MYRLVNFRVKEKREVVLQFTDVRRRPITTWHSRQRMRSVNCDLFSNFQTNLQQIRIINTKVCVTKFAQTFWVIWLSHSGNLRVMYVIFDRIPLLEIVPFKKNQVKESR